MQHLFNILLSDRFATKPWCCRWQRGLISKTGRIDLHLLPGALLRCQFSKPFFPDLHHNENVRCLKKSDSSRSNAASIFCCVVCQLWTPEQCFPSQIHAVFQILQSQIYILILWRHRMSLYIAPTIFPSHLNDNDGHGVAICVLHFIHDTRKAR